MAPRVLSAAVAVLPTLAVLYLGPAYFACFVAIGGAILSWEWSRLCGCNPLSGLGIVVVATLLLSVGLTSFGLLPLAVGAIAVGYAAAMVGAIVTRRRAGHKPDDGMPHGPMWMSFGILYFGPSLMALIWLRTKLGWEPVLWLFLVVWAADTGAYAVGRLVGGPKLAPSVSPAKTWAGLIGGVVCATVIGGLAGHIITGGISRPLLMMGAFLGLVTQAGDLGESWIKRRFGVKDTGTLMPGHGGLLDRVDGLLVASLAWVAIVSVKGGLVSAWS